MVADAAALVVPRSAADLHLKFLNAAGLVGSTLSNLRLILSDPIVGLPALKNYSDNVAELETALRDINTYLSGQNIVYNKAESGYTLFKTFETQ